MLARSGFSIRRFVSQRRPVTGFEDDDVSYFYHDDDEIDTIKAAHKDYLPRIKTWKPSLGIRKGTKPAIIIRRSEDIHKINDIPPLPDTPHSSRSSLCSCEPATPPSSPPRRPGNRSPPRSPLLCPSQLEHGGDARPPSPRVLDHDDESSLQYRPETTANNLLEDPTKPETIPELEEQAESDQLAATTATADKKTQSEGLSDDLQQLIRETDDAFKLRDSFSEAKLHTPTSPHRPAIPVRRNSKRLSQSSIKSPMKNSAAKFPLAPSAARLTSVSVSKTKRTRSKKSSSRRRSSRAISLPKPSSRWTLSESAKDLFTIRIFHRIEADEMLPESTLQEIRMSRACKAGSHWRSLSTDTVSTTASDMTDENDTTPTEPSPIQATQIGAGTLGHSRSRSVPTTATPPFSFPLNKQQAEAAPPKEVSRGDSPTVRNEEEEEEEEEEEDTLPIMIPQRKKMPKSISFKSIAAIFPSSSSSSSTPAPVPTIKSVHRRLPSRQLPPLPTIPEVISTPETSILSPSSVHQAPWSPTSNPKTVNPDDYVILPSTPFSFTMPTFRHGPIRLAKADLSIGKLAAAVDDTLDWTAFQMAILGGAGDFFGESTDYSRPSDAELDELDDVSAWFSGFGFDGPGRLVSDTATITAVSPQTPPQTTVLTDGDSSSTPKMSVSVSSDLPILVETELPPPLPLLDCYQQKQMQKQMHNQHNRQSSTTATTVKMAATMMGGGGGGGKNHAGLEIDPTLRRPSVDSVNSLPQSPMLDLVVSRDVDGNEYVVPMGFNLGHDLGDFLKWEAEHVFGAGYYA
ncbi:hypothetical protein QBC46DRAFT_306949 [Diplogelasinospora grovesii]|uniref:Uncharacterized protein n=1 Tax=Diplogelasinospora grovesii TaxID=303347 RepID=A0AAN6NDH7_9PEZI|nr:hypothetical protein QBC46DRAFT_306949 [Diplogelasinospora grovesii]